VRARALRRLQLSALQIRPMHPDDLDRVDDLHVAAFRHEGPRPAFFRQRLEHLLRTDPAGASVAVGDDGQVAGVGMATRRDGLWGLALLAVDPDAQERGVGRALMAEALTYAEPGDARAILSSTDPRAQRTYAAAGFLPRPAVEASGVVRRDGVPAAPRVRSGGREDLDLCDAVDREARGFARRPDLELFIDLGTSLWIVDDSEGRGYALGSAERLSTLAASDPATAAELLARALAEAGDESYEIGWLTGMNQWAYPLVFAAGLAVKPYGPVWVDGDVGPWANYLPNGALL
jgi:ribosomal protein S18 acetylase RimI-like enzyme